MREDGENGAVRVLADDFETTWLLGADDPGAEVRLQRAAVYRPSLMAARPLTSGAALPTAMKAGRRRISVHWSGTRSGLLPEPAKRLPDTVFKDICR